MTTADEKMQADWQSYRREDWQAAHAQYSARIKELEQKVVKLNHSLSCTKARFIGEHNPPEGTEWWYPGRQDLYFSSADMMKRQNEFIWKDDLGESGYLWPFLPETGLPLLYAPHTKSELERIELEQQLSAITAERDATSVTKILLKVVPGINGMGEEVYAKSIADVEKAFNDLYEEIERLQERAESAEVERDAANAKVRYYESAVTCDIPLIISAGVSAKQISTEKVADVVRERDALKARIEEAAVGEDMIDAVTKAMRRSWQFGQTYWQQADSNSISQQNKSYETQSKFNALVDEVITMLDAIRSRSTKEK